MKKVFVLLFCISIFYLNAEFSQSPDPDPEYSQYVIWKYAEIPSEADILEVEENESETVYIFDYDGVTYVLKK